MKHTNSVNISAAVVMAALLFTSCNKTVSSDFTDTAVLHSYLQAGDIFKLQVGRQIPFDTTVSFSADNINNLNITLRYNTTVYALTPQGNGIYVNNTIHLQQGDNYSVEFPFNGKTVSAASYIPTKPVNYTQSVTQMLILPQVNLPGVPPSSSTVPPLVLHWTNPDASYYFIVVQNMQTSPVPITTGSTNTAAKAFFTQPTNSGTAEIRAADFQFYGNHRIILYHVLPDYAALYQQNSNSSQNLTNPSTAITNGYGIFTGMNSDTVYVNIHQ